MEEDNNKKLKIEFLQFNDKMNKLEQSKLSKLIQENYDLRQKLNELTENITENISNTSEK